MSSLAIGKDELSLDAISGDFGSIVCKNGLDGCLANFRSDLPEDVFGQYDVGEEKDGSPLYRGGRTSRHYLYCQHDQTKNKYIQH